MGGGKRVQSYLSSPKDSQERSGDREDSGPMRDLLGLEVEYEKMLPRTWAQGSNKPGSYTRSAEVGVL